MLMIGPITIMEYFKARLLLLGQATCEKTSILATGIPDNENLAAVTTASARSEIFDVAV